MGGEKGARPGRLQSGCHACHMSGRLWRFSLMLMHTPPTSPTATPRSPGWHAWQNHRHTLYDYRYGLRAWRVARGRGGY